MAWTHQLVTPQTNVYLPPGWNTNLRAALATSAATPMGIGAAGASVIAGGTGVTDALVTGYWPKFRGFFKSAGYAVHGDAFNSRASTNWFGGGVVFSVEPCHYDLNATAWQLVGYGWAPQWTALNNGANPLMHFTHPNVALGYVAQSADIIWWDATGTGGRSFVYNVNGGASQTVNQAAANKLVRTQVANTVPGWTTSGNQVINFMSQSNASTMAILGVLWYPDTANGAGKGGIWYNWDFGTGQLHALGYENAAGNPTDILAQLLGPTNTAAPFTPGFGKPLGCKLYVVDIWDDPDLYSSPNSSNSAHTPAVTQWPADPIEYMRHLQRIRQVSQRLSADLIFHIPNSPSGITSDNTLPAAYHPENGPQYSLAVYQIATLGQCAVLNSQAAWGELGLTLGFQPANNPHPTDAGALDIATRLFTAVMS